MNKSRRDMPVLTSEVNFINLSSDKKSNQNGGFYIPFISKNKYDTEVIEYAKQKDYKIVKFILEHKLATDFSQTDGEGNTLLHYIVKNYEPQIVGILDLILANCSTSSFINIQNKTDYDTPLILAVKKGNNELAEKLIAFGADGSIKNREGLHVIPQTETEDTPFSEVKVNMSVNMPKSVASSKEKIEEIMRTFLNNPIVPTDANAMTSPVSVDRKTLESELPPEFLSAERKVGGGNDNTDTDVFLGKLVEKINQQGGKAKKHVPKKNRMTDSEQLIQTINSQLGAPQPNQQIHPAQIGVPVKNDQQIQLGGADLNTEQLVSKINERYGVPEYSEQRGGSSFTMKGTRQLFVFQDGGKKKSKAKESRMSEFSRLINNQSNEIHERVVKKIMELMKVDEQVARDYKAALWRKVKAEHPDMKSNLDLSVELEKLALKKNLKDVNLEEAKKIREESKKRRTEMINKKKTFTKVKKTSQDSDEMSPTSQNYVPSDGEYSNTSF